MALALKHIKEASIVIDAQLKSGYESSSDFRDAFSKIMKAALTHANHLILKAAWIETKLGLMIAIADEDGLYLLEFIDTRGLENEVRKLIKKLNAAIIFDETKIIKSIKTEIVNYFNGQNFMFNTPIHLMGSSFQSKVWKALLKIPPGETRSYLDIAKSIHAPTACRGVGRANGSNQLAIIIPCHRVINANGDLGGYAGGIIRKQWLLEHERNS